MPKVSDPFVRHVVVPSYNGSDECDEWCTALHLVETMIAEWPVAQLSDLLTCDAKLGRAIGHRAKVKVVQ